MRRHPEGNQSMKNTFLNGRQLGRKASFLGLGLSLLLGACSCSQTSGPDVAHASESGQGVDAQKDPDPSGLLELSLERWQLVAAGDWIQVYDYYGPDYKKMVNLYEFLDGKSHHKYRDPNVKKIVAVEEGKAFVSVEVYWEPTHPLIRSAEGGQDLEDLLPMVETWEWQDGQWFYFKPERRSEFFQRRPDLLKRR